MTIWRDRDIRAARRLHRDAAEVRGLAEQAEQRGDPLSAALCRDFAREEYGRPANRHLKRYRYRRRLATCGGPVVCGVVIVLLLILFL